LSWAFLIAAILSEVAGTLALKVASNGRPRWYGAVTAGYIVAFVMLTLALNDGLALGVAYGIWAAAGVALTAALSKPLFGEPLTPMMMGGIGLIILGVLAIELGSGH
jgi:small multidrug resistance pump